MTTAKLIITVQYEVDLNAGTTTYLGMVNSQEAPVTLAPVTATEPKPAKAAKAASTGDEPVRVPCIHGCDKKNLLPGGQAMHDRYCSVLKAKVLKAASKPGPVEAVKTGAK